jgi:hypothetical protein
MKKIIPVFVALLAIASCICTSCGESGGSNSGSNSNNDLVLPGKDRLWWFEGFDNNDEVNKFIIELKNTGKNGTFSFGVSNFEVPDLYKHFSTTFSGHIDNSASKKEDIFNSIYDYFWIESMFNENTDILPIYNRLSIYFYPFYCLDDVFDNSKIEYEFIDYYDGAYEATFTYDESIIMKVDLSQECGKQIDKEKMISELINNFLFVRYQSKCNVLNKSDGDM